MMQLRNRCNQRVSWGLTCDLNPHSSKDVHSMQLCMLRMSPLSLCYNWCCKDIAQQHNCIYVLQFGIHNTTLLNIMHFCNICRSIRSALTPDTRGCVPLVLERSSACMGNDSSRNILDWQNVGCEISDSSLINVSSARTQMREEQRGVKSVQE